MLLLFSNIPSSCTAADSGDTTSFTYSGHEPAQETISRRALLQFPLFPPSQAACSSTLPTAPCCVSSPGCTVTGGFCVDPVAFSGTCSGTQKECCKCSATFLGETKNNAFCDASCGCSTLSTATDCLSHSDGRDAFRLQPCRWAIDGATFPSGNRCEPLSVATTYTT